MSLLESGADGKTVYQRFSGSGGLASLAVVHCWSTSSSALVARYLIVGSLRRASELVRISIHRLGCSKPVLIRFGLAGFGDDVDRHQGLIEPCSGWKEVDPDLRSSAFFLSRCQSRLRSAFRVGIYLRHQPSSVDGQPGQSELG